MFRKCKKSAVLDTSGTPSDIAARASLVAQQAAANASALAQTAIDAARPVVTPVVHRSASSASGKLSGAAERASSALSGTAEWLAETADHQKALAKKALPKKHRKLKKLAVISALTGAVVAFLKSPFGGKLRDKVTGGPYPDEIEPEGITLSVDAAVESTDDAAGGSGPNGAIEGNGTVAAKATEHTDN